MSFGLNAFPRKSSLDGLVPIAILDGVVGLGGGGGIITQDRFLRPAAPLQANGISLRSRSADDELVGESVPSPSFCGSSVL